MDSIAIVWRLAMAASAVGAPANAAQDAPVAAAMTAQQRFDAASDAVEEDRCAEAVAQFESIEKLPAARRPGFLKSAIAVRKGRCLARLDRGDDAEALIRQGLPALAAAGANFIDERRESHLVLARLARARLDYAAAIAEAQAALAIAQGPGRLIPLLMLVTLTRFDADGAAIGHADEALALARTLGVDKKVLAQIQTQLARAMLNQGQAMAAYPLLQQALDNQGGLTMKVNQAEVATRADLALAAALLGKEREAARYLAYTGVTAAPFELAAEMEAPWCGESTGLKPEDVAVIEFELREDGVVVSSEPIYATGGREGALAFARAVKEWSWTPERAKQVPAFYRQASRVEMRCTTGSTTQSVMTPIDESVASWLAERATPNGDVARLNPGLTQARLLPLWRAALATAIQAGNRIDALIAHIRLGESPLVAIEEQKDHVDRASALADALAAPVSVRGRLALSRVTLVTRDFDPAGANEAGKARRVLLADPRYAGDPLVASTLRLLIAAPHYRRRPPADADALFAAVIAEPGLPDRHPLKINAMLRRANITAKNGDLAGAQAQFAQTGLTEQQCAMIGLKPAFRSSGLSSDDYPARAHQLGFEGWVSLEFDIAADGSALKARTLFAYPPFMFGDTAVAAARRFRYETSYRPAGGAACAANRQNIIFHL